MTTPNTAHAVAPGDLIDGRYRIVELIGEGGMGAVFLAEHVGLSKEVALKVIHPSFAGNGEIRARFAREAMASARVEHPHVASALDIGELPDGAAYLVMPLVRGPSLTEALAGGPMPEARVIELGAQIADALAAAHAAGIIHRDLKPDNVVLMPREDGGDHVKVLDFGIAGLSGEDPSAQKQLTRVGVVMGTPGYMSPEQAIGETVDARTDLYALGVILWEALTGRALFEGDDVAGIVTQQLTTTPTPVRELGVLAQGELEALVARLLSRARDERPESALEVRDALAAMLPEPRPSRLGSGPAPVSAPSSSPTIAGPRAALPTIPAKVAPLAESVRARALRATARFRTMSPRAQVVASVGFVVLLLALVLSVGGEREAEEPAPRVTSTAKKGEREPKKPPAAAPKREESRKGALDDAVQRLVEGNNRSARLAAAREIDASGEAVPEHVRAMVAMELARTCADRKAALARLEELADARTKPYVERWDAAPQKGCGFMKQRDCYACVRADIARALAALD
jgi:eukaryotic-like serine/threonine-protein kinase